jgi:hypothetical protein
VWFLVTEEHRAILDLNDGALRDGHLKDIGGESSISEALTAADEGPERFRDGKGEHEMVPGQLPLPLSFQPLLGLVVLAAGTVTVATTAMNWMKLTTMLTGVEGGAIDFGAAVADSVDDLGMLGGHGFPVALAILRAVDTEEVIDDTPLTGHP